MKKISVALAYYNGGTFIEEQLSSILAQLGPDAEVVISIDEASDGSGAWLDQRSQKDSRIRLIKGPGNGVVANFAHAISQCQGDIIFLSDQDDIWLDHKVEKVMKVFAHKDLDAILHNAILVDEHGKPCDEKTMFDYRSSNTGTLKNVIKNSYVGCCMAFRRELIPYICPIPEQMYMHDFWIGMIAEKRHGVGLIREPLIAYRRHSNNVTEMKHGSLAFMVKKRLDILCCLLERERRFKNQKSDS